MKKKILLAPNSFKESADSVTISNFIFNQLRLSDNFSVIEMPISDGGDGFLSVCEKLYNGIRLTYSVKNVYNDQIGPVDVIYVKSDNTVYVESAEVIGLKKVPGNFRYPMQLNTVPLGQLLKKLVQDVQNSKLRVDRVIIGVGGTSTVDFGLGVAYVFGLKIHNNNGLELDVKPVNFTRIDSIHFEKIILPFKIHIIADVETPLFGKNNAIKVYSEQKGANSDDISELRKGFSNIYNIIKNKGIIEIPNLLYGAGGGLAAGMQIFFNADVTSSKNFINDQILNNINLDEIGAVITGEGSFDKQSLESKGAYTIIHKFMGADLPIFLICGKFDKKVLPDLPEYVKVIELIKYFNSSEESIKNYKTGLKRAVIEIVDYLKN
ncbi:MAG: glycerate kinase [Ignavibacteriaceae bacterium]